MKIYYKKILKFKYLLTKYLKNYKKELNLTFWLTVLIRAINSFL